MGNVRSVYNAISLLGEHVIITDDKDKITNAEAIILPGVGSFFDGMINLEQKGLLELLNEEIIEKKKPYLGICLGLEFLAKTSYEGGEHKGFGWLNGTIEKITPKVSNLKVPHMGWDETKVLKNDGMLKDLVDPSFYYLHTLKSFLQRSRPENLPQKLECAYRFYLKTIYRVKLLPHNQQNFPILLPELLMYLHPNHW